MEACSHTASALNKWSYVLILRKGQNQKFRKKIYHLTPSYIVQFQLVILRPKKHKTDHVEFVATAGFESSRRALGSKINNEQRKNNELQLHAALDMAQNTACGKHVCSN